MPRPKVGSYVSIVLKTLSCDRDASVPTVGPVRYGMMVPSKGNSVLLHILALPQTPPVGPRHTSIIKRQGATTSVSCIRRAETRSTPLCLLTRHARRHSRAPVLRQTQMSVVLPKSIISHRNGTGSSMAREVR